MILTLNADRFDRLVHNAVNYACGRSSYIVGMVNRILRDNLKNLSNPAIDGIVKLIVNKDYGSTNELNSLYAGTWKELVKDLLDQNNPDRSKVEAVFENEDDLRILVLCSFRSTLYQMNDTLEVDYVKLASECPYYIRTWYKSFKADVDEARSLQIDTDQYEDILNYIK